MARGWIKGRKRPPTGKLSHQVGAWSWNSALLHSKIQATGPDKCWTWTGASNDWSNLFGARKHDRPQMTQVNRLLAMEISGEPIDDVAIMMKCKNKKCCNPDHFTTGPNYRRTDLG